MVQQRKYKGVNKVRSPAAHAAGRGLVVVKIGGFLRHHNIDDEGAHISYQHAGGGVQAGRHFKIIERKARNKTGGQQHQPRHGKRQPQNKQKV